MNSPPAGTVESLDEYISGVLPSLINLINTKTCDLTSDEINQIGQSIQNLANTDPDYDPCNSYYNCLLNQFGNAVNNYTPSNNSPAGPVGPQPCFDTDENCRTVNYNGVDPTTLQMCANYVINNSSDASLKEEACDAIKGMLDPNSPCYNQYSQISSSCKGDIRPSNNNDPCTNMLLGKDCVKEVENPKNANYQNYLQCYVSQADSNKNYYQNLSNCVNEWDGNNAYQCANMIKTACNQVFNN
jgi:hypothetical protein